MIEEFSAPVQEISAEEISEQAQRRLNKSNKAVKFFRRIFPAIEERSREKAERAVIDEHKRFEALRAWEIKRQNEERIESERREELGPIGRVLEDARLAIKGAKYRYAGLDLPPRNTSALGVEGKPNVTDYIVKSVFAEQANLHKDGKVMSLKGNRIALATIGQGLEDLEASDGEPLVFMVGIQESHRSVSIVDGFELSPANLTIINAMQPNDFSDIEACVDKFRSMPASPVNGSAYHFNDSDWV
ncbi:TPA: hypothetical protein EYO12_01955 [Candidatus Saccharibacteria bacterium]|nr:hypothetical protein [Candidatus Saccharibacteria bacterium]HIO87482.1 hypothetical protein [Candidatus Saccharibacteria bacterium]